MSFTCSICWSNFHCDDSVNATNCGHVFHVQCLQQWWTVSSSHCPICRSICTVRNTRVLHFSSDNATVEDEFMVDLQHFKSGMKRLLGDQDNEIASLHKQLSEEKRKRLKADGLVQDLNGHLRMEEEKRREDKVAWRRQNDQLKSSNSELLKKTKALQKRMKQTTSHCTTAATDTNESIETPTIDLTPADDDVVKENCGRSAANGANGTVVKKIATKKRTRTENQFDQRISIPQIFQTTEQHVPSSRECPPTAAAAAAVVEAVSLTNLPESQLNRCRMMCIIC